MRVHEHLADAPPWLAAASAIWVLFCTLVALSALWRVLRGPRKESHLSRTDAARRALSMIFWGALVALLLRQILDVTWLREKAASLPLVLVWTALAVPALLLRGQTRTAWWVKWASLTVADFVAAAWFVHALLRGGRELQLPWIVGAVIVLHAAVLLKTNSLGRRALVRRWLGLFLTLLAGADFFVPAATVAGRRPPLPGVVSPVPRMTQAPQQAFFSADGEFAFVLPERRSPRVWYVQLADGEVFVPIENPQQPIERIAVSPDRRFLALAYTSSSRFRVQTFQTDLFAPHLAYEGGEPMVPTALAMTENHVALGGESRHFNLLLCRLVPTSAATAAPVKNYCEELSLPLSRVSEIAMAPERQLLFAAEGASWLADGWRVQAVSLIRGQLMRRLTAGRGVGGLTYDPTYHALFLTRPRHGAVQTHSSDDFAPLGAFAVDPGAAWAAVDAERHWLLSASPTTGYLTVTDLHWRRPLARVPLGGGIRHLDYHAPSGRVLVSADRGLLVVRLLEISELTKDYETR
jgi:hypothetical protein